MPDFEHDQDGGPYLHQVSQAIRVPPETEEDPSLPPPDHATVSDVGSPTKRPRPGTGTTTISSAQRIDSPSASGHSQAIRPSLDSPTWFDDLLRYLFDGPQIHGRSQAIHVHGTVTPFPPQEEWRYCVCEDATLTVPNSVDEYNREVAASSWGSSTIGHPWIVGSAGGAEFFYVAEDLGVARGTHQTDQGEVVEPVAVLDHVYDLPVKWTIRWRAQPSDTGAPSPEDQYIFRFGPARIRFAPVPDPGDLTSLGPADVTIDINNDLGSRYSDWRTTRFEADALKWRHKTWFDGDDPPDTWHAQVNWESEPSDITLDIGLRSLSSNEVRSAELVVDWIRDGRNPDDCEECAGKVPFEPGYLPIFRPQLGDPKTDLDAHISNLEAAAMALDWQTRGEIQVWGGDLVPWCGRSRDDIIAYGTTQENAKQAWLHYKEDLLVRSGGSWSSVLKYIDEGRAVILAGDYEYFTEPCLPGFTGNHAVIVIPSRRNGLILIGDPLCSDYRHVAESELQAYAEAFGAVEFGVTSPQKLIFSVTQAWDFGAGPGELLWPVRGRVTQEYGCTGFYLEPPRGSCAHFHSGIDIATAIGTPVIACADGIVGYIGYSTTGSWMVRIDHGGGLSSRVGHMQVEHLVVLGQAVSRGQTVGHIGLTGMTTGPHTHWEVTVNDVDINPRLKTRGNP